MDSQTTQDCRLSCCFETQGGVLQTFASLRYAHPNITAIKRLRLVSSAQIEFLWVASKPNFSKPYAKYNSKKTS